MKIKVGATLLALNQLLGQTSETLNRELIFYRSFHNKNHKSYDLKGRKAHENQNLIKCNNVFVVIISEILFKQITKQMDLKRKIYNS